MKSLKLVHIHCSRIMILVNTLIFNFNFINDSVSSNRVCLLWKTEKNCNALLCNSHWFHQLITLLQLECRHQTEVRYCLTRPNRIERYGATIYKLHPENTVSGGRFPISVRYAKLQDSHRSLDAWRQQTPPQTHQQYRELEGRGQELRVGFDWRLRQLLQPELPVLAVTVQRGDIHDLRTEIADVLHHEHRHPGVHDQRAVAGHVLAAPGVRRAGHRGPDHATRLLRTTVHDRREDPRVLK